MPGFCYRRHRSGDYFLLPLAPIRCLISSSTPHTYFPHSLKDSPWWIQNPKTGSRPGSESQEGDGGISMIEKKHVGQKFEEFLQEDGIYEQVQLNALKKTLAHQIKALMEERGIPKTEMANRMKTSRSSLDRLLNEDSYNVTIATISKAASVLGKRIELSLVENDG